MCTSLPRKQKLTGVYFLFSPVAYPVSSLQMRWTSCLGPSLHLLCLGPLCVLTGSGVPFLLPLSSSCSRHLLFRNKPKLLKQSVYPTSQNNPHPILFLALFASLLRWGSVSPLSFSATSPRAVCLCASHSPHLHFSFFSMQGWILPLPLCEYSPYEAQEWSCNHVTYLSCWLLCSSWDSLLPCFSVSLSPFGIIFVPCFFWYLSHHPSIPLNIGVS